MPHRLKEFSSHLAAVGLVAKCLAAGVAGPLRHQVIGSEIAEWAKDGELGTGWLAALWFFIPALWQENPPAPTQLFIPIRDGCDQLSKIRAFCQLQKLWDGVLRQKRQLFCTLPIKSMV